MRMFTRVLTALVLILFTQSASAQDCTVDFDLFGNDTLCRSSVPFNLPPVLPFGGVYSGPGVVNYDFFDPQELEPGDYTIYYTYTDETCTSTDSVVITVLPAAETPVDGPFTACAGDSITFFSPENKLILWPDQSIATSWTTISDTTFFFDAYSELSSLCYSHTEYEVRIGAYPDSVDVPNYYAACPGEDVVLGLTPNGNSWGWFDGTGDSTVTVSALTDTEYFVTFYGEFGCDTTVTILLNIDEIENFEVTVNTHICAGDTLTVYQSGAAFCKINEVSFTDSLNLFPQESFTLVVEGYSESECISIYTTEIYVGPVPQVLLSGVEDICAGETVQLFSSGSEFYSYTNITENVEVSNSSESLLLLEPLSTADYVLSGYNTDGCSMEIPFQITVHPLPVVVINPLTPFCMGQDIVLEATGADAYLWNDQSTDTVREFNSLVNLELGITGITSFGCVDSIDYFVEVHPVPVVNVVGPGTVCEGDSTVFVGNGADFYIWESAIEGDTLLVIPVQDSIITLLGTTIFGCQDFTNFNLNVLPAPVTSISGDNDLCFGDETVLSVTSDSPYTWSDGSSATTVFIQPLNDTTLSLLAIGSNGCDRLVNYPILVHDLPVIEVTGPDTLCYGESITLTASGAITWYWSSGSTDATTLVSPVTTTNYRATGWNEFNCPGEAIYSVVVNPTPIVYFAFNVDAVCDLGPELTWVANPSGGVLSGDGVSDNWFNPADALVGENTVVYTVTNEYNCSSSSSEVLVVDDCSAIGYAPAEYLHIYPVPASDYVVVESSGDAIDSYILLDAGGRVVLMPESLTTSSRCEIDLSPLAAGVYTLRASLNSGEIKTQKIVVQ